MFLTIAIIVVAVLAVIVAAIVISDNNEVERRGEESLRSLETRQFERRRNESYRRSFGGY